MLGGDLYPVKVTLRDPVDQQRQISYVIQPDDNPLARDWQQALCEILDQNLHLEKNFCFLGFPHTARSVQYLCNELNRHIHCINRFNCTGAWAAAGLGEYWIEEWFDDASVRYANDTELGTKQMSIKHNIMNRLHNHFERLQGRVWDLSEYYRHADAPTKYAIRQLNNICHELESLVLSQRKLVTNPHWVRPSQITTFLNSRRYQLTDQHRLGFAVNGYDRVFGGVYMHWAQIGKTLFEVFRDEEAPQLTLGQDVTDITVGSGSTCEAITALKFYSGEFDIEWGRDVVLGGAHPWHDQEQQQFRLWIESNGLDFSDPRLSLGYLKIGQVNIDQSFPGMSIEQIWQALGEHLDIYKIEINGHAATYDYCWSDIDHESRQISSLERT
jgi:hypothetical protein